MRKVPAFWDASALVPLCVHEMVSRQAHSCVRKFSPVAWWGSMVEIHGAISRLHRAGVLNDLEKTGALTRLSVLSRSWGEILPDNQLRESSGHLLDTHELRAADSLQLAAALIWCQQRPARRTFVCADRRLSKAAQLVGFSVLQLP